MEKRRAFLKKLGLASGAALVVPSLSSCTTLSRVQGVADNNEIRVQLPANQSFPFIVDHPKSEIPILITKKEKLRAFLMLCTHKDCTVNPAGAVLLCPCHGSEFSFSGEVLTGPAENPLHEYSVSQTNGVLTIKLNQQ